jgi:hypothetical protein
LYELTTIFETGYTFTEIKFIINDIVQEPRQQENDLTTTNTLYRAKSTRDNGKCFTVMVLPIPN